MLESPQPWKEQRSESIASIEISIILDGGGGGGGGARGAEFNSTIPDSHSREHFTLRRITTRLRLILEIVIKASTSLFLPLDGTRC